MHRAIRGAAASHTNRDAARTATRMRRWAVVLLLGAMLPLATGCMYPKERRAENQVAAQESILVVQHAVEQYKEKTGVLPVKNFDKDTPFYEQYKIDIKKLTQGPYLGQIPSIAFEKGGSYLFVLVNAEEHPEVKLLDVTVHQAVADVQRNVDAYRTKNGGQLPLGEAAGDGVYRLDFSKMGQKTAQVPSMFSRQYLGYLIDDKGTVAVDYAPDIMHALEGQASASIDETTDLRAYLVEASPYVPVQSFVYHWKQNEPRPVASEKR